MTTSHSSYIFDRTWRIAWQWSLHLKAFCLAALLVMGVFQVQPAQATNYLEIGCYHEKSEGRIWLALSALNPKYLPGTFDYDQTSSNLALRIESGNNRIPLTSEDIVINLLGDFNRKIDAKYNFMKFSLVVDYSTSIDNYTMNQVMEALDEFVGKLPHAIEGQVVKFSDSVDATPFTKDLDEIRRQVRTPPVRGGTALHDALMTAVAELGRNGDPNVPLSVIVLFTDGKDTRSQAYKERQSFIRSFTSAAKGLKIAVMVIGVTADVDEDLMREIAGPQAGIKGIYQHIPDFQNFRKALNQIEKIINNTILLRFAKVGQDKGPLKIHVGELVGQTQNFQTIQTVECNF